MALMLCSDHSRLQHLRTRLPLLPAALRGLLLRVLASTGQDDLLLETLQPVSNSDLTDEEIIQKGLALLRQVLFALRSHDHAQVSCSGWPVSSWISHILFFLSSFLGQGKKEDFQELQVAVMARPSTSGSAPWRSVVNVLCWTCCAVIAILLRR